MQPRHPQTEPIALARYLPFNTRKEDTPMMNVTPQARDYLLALRNEANLSHPDMALRMVLGPPGRLGLLPGVRNPGDSAVTRGGLAILLLDPAVASALDRATLVPQPLFLGAVNLDVARSRVAHDLR